MTLYEVEKKYVGIIDAICMCGEKNYCEAALILLYSSIDALSWLYSEQENIDKRNMSEDYKKWVNTFLLPNLNEYDCTATEIYLSRCSILHTCSAVAKNQKDNRIVTYVCGNKENTKEDIKRIDKMLPDHKNEFVIIHLGDLVKAYIEGTLTFFKQVEKNEKLYKKVLSKAGNYFTDLHDILNYC